MYWHVNILRENSQSGLVSVKDKNRDTIRDNKRVKEEWVEHFQNVLNHSRVTGEYIENNEKVDDTLDVKEDLFC